MKISMTCCLAVALLAFGAAHSAADEPKHKLLHERTVEDYRRLFHGDVGKIYEKAGNLKYIRHNEMEKLLLEFGVPESKLMEGDTEYPNWQKKTLIARDIEKIDNLKMLEHESPILVVVQVPGKDGGLEKYQIQWNVFRSEIDLRVYGLSNYFIFVPIESMLSYLYAGPIDGPGDVCFVPMFSDHEKRHTLDFNSMLFWRGTTLVHILNLDATDNEDAIFKLAEELDKILIERQNPEPKKE